MPILVARAARRAFALPSVRDTALEAQDNACGPNSNGDGASCLPTVPITTSTGLPSPSFSSSMATSTPTTEVVSPPSSSNGRVITGVSVGVILFLTLAFGALFWLRRRRRQEKKTAGSEQGPRKWDALSSQDSGRDTTNSLGARPHERTARMEKTALRPQHSFADTHTLGSSPRKPAALPALPHAAVVDRPRELYRSPSSSTSSHTPSHRKPPPMIERSYSVGPSVSAAPPVGSASAEHRTPNSSMGLRFSQSLFIPGPIERSNSMSTTTTNHTTAKRYSFTSGTTGSTSSHSTSSHASVTAFPAQSSSALLLQPGSASRSNQPGYGVSRKPSSIKRKPVPAYDDSSDAPTSSSFSRALPSSSAMAGAHRSTRGRAPRAQSSFHLKRSVSFDSNSTGERRAPRPVMVDPYAGFQI